MKGENFEFTKKTLNMKNEELIFRVPIDKILKETPKDEINSVKNNLEFPVGKTKNPNILSILSPYSYEKDIDLDKDVDLLYQLLNNFDFDKNKEGANKLIHIFLNRSPFQLKEIQKRYDNKYPKMNDEKGKPNKTLFELIKKKCNNDFFECIEDLCDYPVEADCKRIYSEGKSFKPNLRILGRIFAWKMPWELKELKNCFAALYDIDLADFLKDKFNEEENFILQKMLECKRDANHKPLIKRCQKDLKKMLELGDNFWNVKNEHFQLIFFSRSFADIREIMENYKKEINISIDEKIKLIKNKDQKRLLKPLFYGKMESYAYEVFKSIEGIGTDEACLNEGLNKLRKNNLMSEALKYYSETFKGKETMFKAIDGDVNDNEYRAILYEMINSSNKNP